MKSEKKKKGQRINNKHNLKNFKLRKGPSSHEFQTSQAIVFSDRKWSDCSRRDKSAMAKSEHSRTPSFSSFAKIQPSDDADADPDSYALEKFKLYETRAVSFINLKVSKLGSAMPRSISV